MSVTLATIIDLKQALLAVPNPAPAAPPGIGPAMTTLLSWIAWGGGTACLIGLIIQGARMAIAHKRNQEFDGSGLGMVAMGAIFVASAGTILTGIVG